MNGALQPIMHVVTIVPIESGTWVAEGLLQRGGHILSRDHRGDKQVIRARVPQAGMIDFWSELSDRTGGRGTFSMVLYQYTPVPEAPHAPPNEPEGGVREPRPRTPRGRTGAISVAEPEPDTTDNP